MATEKNSEEKEIIIEKQDNNNKQKHKSGKPTSRSKSKDKEVNKLKSELEEMKDKYIRLYSEFENFRRRTAKEKLELVGTANEDLMLEILPVIDDFERAMQSFDSNEGNESALKEGVQLIYNKLKTATEKKGLKKMDTEPGDEFNPEIHDAISHIPAPEDKLKGKIIDTIENGYYLNEKVIRFAKVVTGA